MLGQITNPIIRGFNPDPSIIRVDDDYYIATSTFEWFPGVQIHHSKDLVNWTLLTHPLSRKSQLNLIGVPDSCGVWAPCLSYRDGTFYLVYSNVKSFNGVWKDTPNYLVTAKDILGPWSEPIYLNSSGFDASLFHDDDGRSYLLNMLIDHRRGRLFGGIVMQEFDLEKSQLVGTVHYLASGTEHGCAEGPHLYKRNNYYYLMLAEGGTGYDHCVTLMRSKSIIGPYETHPENPIITAKDSPDSELQKAGHADLISTSEDEWYLVFLTGRPLSQLGRCTLGRETSIAPVYWGDDDWLYHTSETRAPQMTISAPHAARNVEQNNNQSKEISFSDKRPLDINLQSLREPISDEWVSVNARPGHLRIIGRESLSSTFHQSILGHRLQAHHASVSTCVEFTPKSYQQMAGLVCYYNTRHYHYLHIRGDSELNDSNHKFLTITSCDNGEIIEPIDGGIDVSLAEKIWLKAEFKFETIQFYYSLIKPVCEADWLRIGAPLDGSILSDDYVAHEETGFEPCFTGVFFAICCQDLSGQRNHADFAWFNYHEISSL